jgi:hypothetical protein
VRKGRTALPWATDEASTRVHKMHKTVLSDVSSFNEFLVNIIMLIMPVECWKSSRKIKERQLFDQS